MCLELLATIRVRSTKQSKAKNQTWTRHNLAAMPTFFCFIFSKHKEDKMMLCYSKYIFKDRMTICWTHCVLVFFLWCILGDRFVEWHHHHDKINLMKNEIMPNISKLICKQSAAQKKKRNTKDVTSALPKKSCAFKIPYTTWNRNFA